MISDNNFDNTRMSNLAVLREDYLLIYKMFCDFSWILIV